MRLHLISFTVVHAFLLLGASESSHAAAGFGTGATTSVGFEPRSMSTSDFNQDGNADLWVAGGGGQANVARLLQNAGGTANGEFPSAVNFLFSGPHLSIASGDINGDGDPDLVRALGISPSIEVVLGRGASPDGDSGFFEAGSAVTLPVPAQPESLLIVDVDNDGDGDIIYASPLDNTVGVFRVSAGPRGSFGAVNVSALSSFPAGFAPIAVSSGDFDQDGNMDIVTANFFGGVSVLLGDGAGSFGPATSFDTLNQSMSLTVADLNADGKLDVVTANLFANSVSVYLGTGAGSLLAPRDFAVGSQPVSITSLDANLDGRLDIATANSLGDDVSLVFGDGDGSLGAPFSIPAGRGPAAILSTDFDQDGLPDLAVANEGDRNVMVLLNGPVDADGDGFVNTVDCADDDSISFPGQVWFADLDNDGVSDGTSIQSCLRPAGFKAGSELIATFGDCDDLDALLLQCNTPVGSQPIDFTVQSEQGDVDGTVTIQGVVEPGDTVVTSQDPCGISDTNPGFQLLASPICVQVETTATITQAEVCVAFDPTTVFPGQRLLIQCKDSPPSCVAVPFQEVSVSPSRSLACGVVDGFSTFTVGKGMDSDFDFVPDLIDNCPTVFNISQLDSDGDGIGDACDGE